MEFSFAPKVHQQYALRARASGYYPVMERGSKDPVSFVYLKEGDVWKFGTTDNPAKRYSKTELDEIGDFGVKYTREFLGTEKQAKLLQNMKIVNYFLQHGRLPPGNKIVN